MKLKPLRVSIVLPAALWPFTSSEAALLLVSTKNHDLWPTSGDLWPGLTPEVRDSRTSRHYARAQSQV